MAVTSGNADIRLLFGMAGGGSISGKSGQQIQGELNQLVKELNKEAEVTKRRLEFTLDKKTTRENVNKNLAQICKQLKNNPEYKDKFIVDVVRLNTEAPIAKFRSEMTALLESLENEFNIVLNVGTDVTTPQSSSTGSPEQKYVSYKKLEPLLRTVNSLLRQIHTIEQNWTAAKSGEKAEAYDEVVAAGKELAQTQEEIDAAIEAAEPIANETYSKFADKVGSAKLYVDSLGTEIKVANENTKSFADRVGTLADKFTVWFSVSQVIMTIIRAMKQMVKTTIEIDDAMTELRKVTEETEETYIRFLDTATERAKKLGATIADTASASADFARLGYGLDDAAELADAAIVYKNVGDGIDDISTASESIISTMKAFGIEAEGAMLIVDKFNITGM